MSRISLILLLSVLVSGCSVLRNRTKNYAEAERDSLDLINSIRERNITKTNFYIQKAEVEIVNNTGKQRLLANLKYQNPATYLISIRTRTGIEAARLYLTKDTIFINDRINRKLYCASTRYINNKYGISTETLPLIFGDFMYSMEYNKEKMKCSGGTKIIEEYLKNGRLIYRIDCNIKKPVNSEFKNETGNNGIIMEFSNFQKEEKYIFPQKIRIQDTKKETTINISILNIEFNRDEKLNFIPGNNYEKVILK